MGNASAGRALAQSQRNSANMFGERHARMAATEFQGHQETLVHGRRGRSELLAACRWVAMGCARPGVVSWRLGTVSRNWRKRTDADGMYIACNNIMLVVITSRLVCHV